MLSVATFVAVEDHAAFLGHIRHLIRDRGESVTYFFRQLRLRRRRVTDYVVNTVKLEKPLVRKLNEYLLGHID